jgi:hypothetical protein
MGVTGRLGGFAHIKAVAKFELFFLARLHEQTLCGTSSPSTNPPQAGEVGRCAVRAEESADDKVAYRRDEE